MRFLPVGLELEDRRCVVVGGGVVGTRKVKSLLQAGARVTVVSPEITDALRADVDAGHVRWAEDTFQPGYLDGARLVILATDDPATNERVAELAHERGTLLCDATSAERSDVIFGALLEEEGVTVATFTDGRDPARARRTRDRIADWLAAGRNGAAPSAHTLLVLVAHGSRNPDWSDPLEALTARVAEHAAEHVRLAYSQFQKPSLADVVEEAVGAGYRRVRVLPLFMTARGHVERDIRPALDALRRAHETIELELLPPVGELPSFEKILVELAREVTR